MSLKKAHELTRELTHAPANTCRPQHAHVRPHHGTSNARPGEPLPELGGANLERVREDDGRLRPVRRCRWGAQRLVALLGVASQRARGALVELLERDVPFILIAWRQRASSCLAAGLLACICCQCEKSCEGLQLPFIRKKPCVQRGPSKGQIKGAEDGARVGQEIWVAHHHVGELAHHEELLGPHFGFLRKTSLAFSVHSPSACCPAPAP